MATVRTVSKYPTDAQLAYPEHQSDVQLAYPDHGNNFPAGLVDPVDPIDPVGPVDLVDPVVPADPDASPSTCGTYIALMALFLISLGHQLSCWETYNLSDATGSQSDSGCSGSAPSLVSDTSGISSREDTNPGDSYDFGSGGGATYGPDSVPRTVPGALRGIGSRFEGT